MMKKMDVAVGRRGRVTFRQQRHRTTDTKEAHYETSKGTYPSNKVKRNVSRLYIRHAYVHYSIVESLPLLLGPPIQAKGTAVYHSASFSSLGRFQFGRTHDRLADKGIRNSPSAAITFEHLGTRFLHNTT